MTSDDPYARLTAFLRSELERSLPEALRADYRALLIRLLGADSSPVEALGLSKRWEAPCADHQASDGPGVA